MVLNDGIFSDVSDILELEEIIEVLGFEPVRTDLVEGNEGVISFK